MVEAPSAVAASTSSSRRVNRARPAPLALSTSSVGGASGEQRRKEVRRHDDKPSGDRLDCCDDLITAGPAIEDGPRARVKRANGVLAVRSFEHNHQRYRIASGAIFGQ